MSIFKVDQTTKTQVRHDIYQGGGGNRQKGKKGTNAGKIMGERARKFDGNSKGFNLDMGKNQDDMSDDEFERY